MTYLYKPHMKKMLLVWPALTLTYCITSYANIIFYLHLSDLFPFSQEYNYGIKQGLPLQHKFHHKLCKNKIMLYNFLETINTAARTLSACYW